MIEITTSNSTKVNELLFAFGNLRSEVMVITMTTPTLSLFHQKIFSHAKAATDIYLTKNNPFRPLRELNPTPHPATAGSAKRDHFSAFSFLKFRIPHFAFPNQIPPSRLYPDSVGAWRPLREQSAFTLIELLAVITIIGILAGLTLGAAGAVRRHGATSTAKAEVAALQAACDRYYADNNAYPIGTASPTTVTAPADATVLFTNLLGSATFTAAPTSKRYFEPNPAMVKTTITPNSFIDPWGYAYGYNSDGTTAPLIWSTAGGGNTNRWITSWPKM
jgi:prepilin-type N-terminal cleavage/methylation domain-containing protein